MHICFSSPMEERKNNQKNEEAVPAAGQKLQRTLRRVSHQRRTLAQVLSGKFSDSAGVNRAGGVLK